MSFSYKTLNSPREQSNGKQRKVSSYGLIMLSGAKEKRAESKKKENNSRMQRCMLDPLVINFYTKITISKHVSRCRVIC